MLILEIMDYNAKKYLRGIVQRKRRGSKERNEKGAIRDTNKK